MQFTVAQRRWKWSHEKETLPCNSGSRPQVGSDIIHCETTSVLISLPSSSLLLLVFTDMHTDSVFSGPSVSLCALLPFWRQKRKRGSPVRRDHSRVWSLRLRYTNHSGTFQSQGRPQVIPLNTHSFKSCANERLIVCTTLRSPSLDPSRASLYRTLTSTSSHILFSDFSAWKKTFHSDFFPSPCRSVLLTLYSPRLLSSALLPYLRGEVTRFLSDCLGQ